jgi:integrase
MANRTLAHLRKMLNWCVSRHLIDDNPCRRVSAPTKEVSRDRVLSNDELAKAWQATFEMPYPTGPYFRLLILTGQREKEVAHMRWSDIDLEAKTWTIPAELAKNNQEHLVPLSERALEELAKLPRAGDYAISGSLGERPFSGFSAAKRRLDELSGVTGWRIHDIRRTVATGMARAGVNRFVIKRVLNHVDRDVTGIYDRHEYLDKKRDALSRWSSITADVC